MKKLIIIGGGIQGCTLAIHLLESSRLRLNDILIIDKNKEPLANWKRCTDAISMPYLRSPSVHHLDVNPFSLEKFSKEEGYHKVNHFYGYYDRPSLELFNGHCDRLVRQLKIETCWHQGSVHSIDKGKGCWTISTDEGTVFRSEKVVLAMGLSCQPSWSDWGTEAKSRGASIYHVFDEGLTLSELSPPISVIGGGISAAHLTLRLKGLFPGKVTLIHKKPLDIKTFDSDPGWQGPMYMTKFQETKDYGWRRMTIIQARHKGSITKELYHQLKKAERQGEVDLVQEEAETYHVDEQNILFKSGNQLKAHSLILATGFNASPPGMGWLKKTIQKENLQCGECGYPIVTPETLEWGKDLYVMGPLAELEIGPVARNIAGARRAADRIMNAI